MSILYSLSTKLKVTLLSYFVMCNIWEKFHI